MLLQDTLATALKGITANVTRSLLTTLGIMIGVGSVVLMVSMGASFQNYIISQVESIGTNTVEIMPQGLEKFGGDLTSLTFDDFEAVSQLSTVEQGTPVIILSQPMSYGKEEVKPFTFGAYPLMADNYALKLDHGRMLDQTDENGARASVVIGSKTAEDLFGNSEPVGKRVTVGENSFTVVGVLKTTGSALLSQMDSSAFVPFSTARAQTGQKHLTYMMFKGIGDTDLVTQDVTALLRQQHRIKNDENDPDKDDFIVRSAEQATSVIGTVTLGLTIFLALVAGISLVVGGIGIMNIMLVTVTERTREIGLRKAVGAMRRDIMRQFLFEAVSLTLSGGAIGIVGGAGLGWMMAKLAEKFLGPFPFILSPSAILIAAAMAIGTGLIFGLYPARRAAMLSPMEALRYE
ncbi:MAG: ABC transporter permease [Candidatus Peribacteraceae bacterium]|nr:ABC transporter permease [Candidatus Peribacteraceae bacterium]